MKEVKVPPIPFEPSVFQKEVIAAMHLEKNNYPLDVHRLRQLTGKRVIGVDLAQEGGDKTSIIEAIRGKHGEIFIIDEYSSMPDWKWYRNPIKWWQWRKFWKSVVKSSKKFTVNIDLDKSVKKDETSI